MRTEASDQVPMAHHDTAAGYSVPRFAALPFPVRNMLRRWRGMIGMVIGVGIALGIGMTFLAVGKAANELYTADYRKSSANLYAITEGGKMIAILPGDSPGAVKGARHVLSQIRGIPQVRGALAVMTWPMERERPGPRRRDQPVELVSVMGVDGDPAQIPNSLDLKRGRWLRRSGEVVLGDQLSREKKLDLGAALRLNGRDFTVVGVGRLRGFGYAANGMAFMDYAAFRQRAGIGDVVNVIAVAAERPETARLRLEEIGSLAAYTPQDLLRQAAQANASGEALRLIINLLTLSIAAIFVSNMLSRSVAERRLEFATMRAIGLPRRTILLIVAAEAVMISLLAGVVGAGISLIMGAGINGLVAKQFGIESLYAADAGLFLLVFALALGLGLIAGLFPARQATRVDPVEILREA